MALVGTQLTAPITVNQLSFSVVNGSVTGAPPVGALPLSYGVPTLIDSEFMYLVSQPVANFFVVRGRGSDGTAPSAHDALANVYLGPLPGDFAQPFAGSAVTIDISSDTAISIGSTSITIPAPTANSVYNINAATAAAIVLGAPSLGSNAVSLEFVSNTAAAHTITSTGLIRDASGTLRNTMTFNGQIGASVNLVVENGFYLVSGTALGVTFS